MKVECPRCRGLIDSRATRCQHCQADFTPEETASFAASDKRRQNGCLALFGLIVVVLIIGQCSAQNAGSGDAAISKFGGIEPVGSMLPKAGTPSEPVSGWTYDRRRDDLRNGDIVEASVRSQNSVDLGFPYGRINLNMVVRQHPEWGHDVIFIADTGQILCRIRSCSGMISFDGAPERLSLNESADNNSAVVFAVYAPAITRKLQASDRVIVELPFYQNGNLQFTFNTAGLQWPPAVAAEAASE